MGLTGLEPVTLRLSSACSNQLSYRPGVRSQHVRVPSLFEISGELSRTKHGYSPKLWPAKPASSRAREQSLEVRGLEPLTYSLQSYRSTN